MSDFASLIPEVRAYNGAGGKRFRNNKRVRKRSMPEKNRHHGLVPVIHVFLFLPAKGVDGGNKSGHNENEIRPKSAGRPA
jgi:hypothetical protein